MANEYDITQPYLGLIQKYRPKPDINAEDEQRKIAKGNAIAEAFRLMIDAVGGSKGANIMDRSADNPVLKAVDNYYRIKEQNKAQQERWDLAELGQATKALETESQQRFTKGQAEEQRKFAGEQQIAQQEFTAGETEKTRGQRAAETEAELKQKADQFRQTFGLQTEKQKTDAEIEREKIEASKERYRIMYPYGREKGMVVQDTDIQQEVRIPDDKKSQVLAFIEADGNVKNEIPVIKLRYGNVPPATATDFMIADLYSSLMPETRTKIREFLKQSGSVKQPPAQGFQPFPVYPGKGPLLSQTPIKTDKSSTMVEAQPQEQPAAQGQALEPEQFQYIKKVIELKGYTPEVKRALVYKYLVDQGYDKGNAKTSAESVYQSLMQN